MSENFILQCSHLRVEVKGKTLLSDVSFSVEKGEHLAIIGPNGAGKSTLVKSLLGLRSYSNGSITIGGEDIAFMQRRAIARKVAYVPQLLAAEVPYSVREFVEMGRYAHAEVSDAVDKALEVVQVADLADRVVSTLSGGERQRVCIAAALAQEAPLLVLDEPLVHLDPGQRIEVQRVIRNLKQSVTVIVVTHDLTWAKTDFSKLIAIEASELVYDGSASRFFEDSRVDALFGDGVSEAVLGGRGV